MDTYFCFGGSMVIKIIVVAFKNAIKKIKNDKEFHTPLSIQYLLTKKRPKD